MGAYNHLNAILLRDEAGEVIKPRARGIAYHKSCCKVDDTHTVLYHFLRSILYIPARTAAAGSEGCYLNIFIPVPVKSTLTVAE